MSTRQSPISQSKNQSASNTTPAKPEAQESKSLRPSAQKNSNKATPVTEIKSASKRSVTPSGAKDRVLGTPNPKVTPFQEKGSAQQVRESSSKKNELTVPSASKNNQASASKKSPQNFQQTTLSPGSTKFVTRSANKEDVMPGLNPILEDLENEANKNGLSLDLRKDLNAILDDNSADVKITATKIIKEYDVTPSKEAGQNRSSAKTKSQQKQVSESKKSKDKSVTRLDLEGIEVRGSSRGSEVKVEENNGIDVEEEEEKQEGQAEERSVARKEYSVYEDWRILETVEKEVSAGGKVSRNFWNTIDDSLTGKRLLDGKRTSESMRDRYKRYIAFLDEVGKDTLREFAQNNDLETMKKYHCIFKKVGGLKQFMGVSDQLNYNPDRIQRKTPYGTKSQKEEQKASTKRGGRKNAGQVERDFEEETFEHQMEEELGEIEDDLFELTERDITFATSEVRQAPLKTKQFEVQRPSQDQANKRKPNATSTRTIIRDDVAPVKRQERRAPARVEPEFIEDFEEEGAPIIEEFVSIDEAKRRALKRKVPKDDNYEAVISSVAPTIHREMKKVRITTHYDDSSLQLNDVFRDRKHGKPAKNVDQENLMVLVDLSKGFRQFVREPEEDEREVENRKLKKLAEKYKIAFNEVVLIFRRVSYDYADLEEFLKRKDAKLLWTEEEDTDLLENNYTAIKYLKILKGEERVQKRMNYLMGNL